MDHRMNPAGEIEPSGSSVPFTDPTCQGTPAVVVLDPRNRVVAANARARRLLRSIEADGSMPLDIDGRTSTGSAQTASIWRSASGPVMVDFLEVGAQRVMSSRVAASDASPADTDSLQRLIERRLHDDLAQSLAGVRLWVDLAVDGEIPCEEALQRVAPELSRGVDRLRELLVELRGPMGRPG